MPLITFDARTLVINGRRRWLTGGVIDYSRTPRELWESRIRAAKQAGLNTIVAPLNWKLHEPTPGRFNFKDDLDVRAFVELIHEFDLMVVLRAGPYIGAPSDLGGLPAWLLEEDGVILRSNHPSYMEAVGRWISAAMKQVSDLQATSRTPGPIVLFQVEHDWNCGDEAVGQPYLGELTRHLRENGAAAPFINCNSLYQTVEGEIDGWTGFDNLHAILRQLHSVRPDAPAFVIDFSAAGPDVWNRPTKIEPSPDQIIARMAQALAADGQILIGPFSAGTSFGFQSGRLPDQRDAFITSAGNPAAPITQTGARNEIYDAMKRVCSFATSFERVFVGLEPDFRPVMLTPGAEGDARYTVVYSRGLQGSIAFIFGDDKPGAKRKSVTITLPDGTTLPVDLKGQSVVWCLLNALIGSRAMLDYCNLNAFTTVDDIFVCYGPAGSPAILSIEGARLEATVPSGKTPFIQRHEGVTVVVCNEKQIDAAVALDDEVLIGARGADADGNPIPHPDFKQVTRIRAGEQVSTGAAPKATTPPRAPSLTGWKRADVAEYVDGSSARYATIEGPDSLERLGAPEGYGWMRFDLRAASSKKTTLGIFHAADRAHLYKGGKLIKIYGLGPGASEENVAMQLSKGDNRIAVLVDNLGRTTTGGPRPGRKGVYGHVYEITPFKAGAAKLETAAPIDPLEDFSPTWRHIPGEKTDAQRLTWSFTHRKKSPIALTIDALPDDLLARGVIVLNDEPFAFFNTGAWTRCVFTSDDLRQGKNTIQLATLEPMAELDKHLKSATNIYECVTNLTKDSDWAFARWERPAPGQFRDVAKTEMDGAKGSPTWWRASFKPSSTGAPLLFDATGLTKGQLYLNGRNLCRFFVATPTGKKVPPQSLYYLPEPWIDTEGENELLIFDEHGASPAKAKLTYEK